MKALIVFGLMFSCTPSFARTITIVVDGEVLSCSSGEGGVSGCDKVSVELKAKYDGCYEILKAIEYPSKAEHCFINVYKEADKTCGAVRENCRETCKTVGYTNAKEFCHKACY